jgi:chromosome segregation ATPase
MMQDVANCKANNLTLERRVQATAKEAAQAVAIKSALEESVKKANKELASLQKSMEAKEERYKLEMDRLSDELAQSDSRLKVQLASVTNLLVEEQAKCKELERQYLDIQGFATKQINDLAKDMKQTDDSEKQLLFARDQITKHENSILGLQRELAHAHQNHHNEVQRLQHACEACHKDLNLVLFEKEAMDKNSAADKIKLVQIQKLLEETEISMQKLENKYHSIVGEKTNLLQNIDELVDENGALKTKLQCASEDLRLLKENEASERKKTEGALKNEVGKVRQELEKEKRRSSAYKTKAIESHRRSIQAKEVLDSLCG